MLVIRRRAGESIQIADNIVLQVLEISPSRVKLGIIAPPAVTILRPETSLSAEENLRASASLPAAEVNLKDVLGREPLP